MDKELLKQARQLSGLSQYELALMVGRSHSLICRIENGSAPLTDELKHKIVQVFYENGISIEDMGVLKQLMDKQKRG